MAISNAEAKFCIMAQGICETPMRFYCDNKSVINITHNPIQHDRTKHVKVDRHFIKEKLDIDLTYVSALFQDIIDKLGMDDIYSPA